MEEHVLAVGISEAARRLGVCARTITNLVATKELISRKIGRRRVVPVTALEGFLKRDHPVLTKPRCRQAARTPRGKESIAVQPETVTNA